jgi:hypothetical protein
LTKALNLAAGSLKKAKGGQSMAQDVVFFYVEKAP